jgi:hypothetical protein
VEAARKPLTHYAHEAMLACHEIARRRAVGRPLGDRLAATDAAMARYRETLHEAYRAARERRIRPGPSAPAKRTRRASPRNPAC